MINGTFMRYRKSGEIEAHLLTEAIEIPQYKGTGTLTGNRRDWLARDPNNHEDQWIIEADYFAEHYVICA